MAGVLPTPFFRAIVDTAVDAIVVIDRFSLEQRWICQLDLHNDA
jgi:hypothetical protein